MPRTYWRPLASLLALGLAGPAVHAQCTSSSSCCTAHSVESKLVKKTYPVGPLLHTFGNCPNCPDLLIQFMTQCVAPNSWSGHGGQGTMSFCPMRMALIVRQTPEVQKQVGGLVKAMDKMASVYGGPMSLVPVGCPLLPPPPPLPPAACAYGPEKPIHEPQPKQHFRFILDNLRIRTEDKAIVTIKHVEVEYAGDGIDADVAKCAITLGESEKKAEKSEEKSDKGETNAASDKAEEADKAEEKSEKAEKSEEKSDKVEPMKKNEEEKDSED